MTEGKSTGIPTIQEELRDNGSPKATSVEDAILQLIRMNKYVTREEMASQIEVSLSTVKRSINKLKTSGIIEYEGPSKGGYWSIK